MKFLGSKLIETERLELRPQTFAEQKYLWSVLMLPNVRKLYLTVPRKFREKLLDWNIQEKFYQSDMMHANDLDVFKWSVFLKETGECIGRVSCQDGEDPNNKSVRDVGWYFDPSHHRKGYCSEAASAMIDYMFRECEIDAIETGAAVDNPASWLIMEKFGFTRREEKGMCSYTFLDEDVEIYKYFLTREKYLESDKGKTFVK